MPGARCSNLIDLLKSCSTQSCRKLAKQLNRSKSSVQREKTKINNRAHFLGAEFFESDDGQQWIQRLVVVTILVFGIIAGVGAERIAWYFSMIYISAFAATSTSKIAAMENQIDGLILKYQAAMDAKVLEKASAIDIMPGCDETYFERLMILVMMDLNSGFIFHEKPADKRDHKTWEAATLSWIPKFKSTRCFVSDKARALLKLAKDTLKVDRIPDLFHMMHDISKTMRYSFHRLKSSGEKTIDEINTLILKGESVDKNTQLLHDEEAKLQSITKSQKTYQKNLRRLSTVDHPFAVLTSAHQNAAIVEKTMHSSLVAIRAIKEQFNISDAKNRLDRVERQIPDAAKQIDNWWGWVHNSLEGSAPNPELKEWLLNHLLPFVYWRSRLRKTRSKTIKWYYLRSLKNAEIKLSQHSLTKLHQEGDEPLWWQWAEQMCQLFIRTTSAIEGRNGWLAQMHFNGRGLSEKRIQSQTAVHNYFLKRGDGTTACERLSGIKPDDLLTYILDNIDPLSQPRRRKNQESAKSLISQSVPA